MTDVRKVDIVSAQTTKTQAAANPIEKEKAEKAKLNA